ncbi:hypothetical protein RA261_27720, partial [Pseudomonas syringae pv. tagetis]
TCRTKGSAGSNKKRETQRSNATNRKQKPQDHTPTTPNTQESEDKNKKKTKINISDRIDKLYNFRGNLDALNNTAMNLAKTKFETHT